MVADIYGFAYAATVAAGGIMGYVKARKIIFNPIFFFSFDVIIVLDI